MHKRLVLLVPLYFLLVSLGLGTGTALAADVTLPVDYKATSLAKPFGVSDSKALEKELQRLPWDDFRSVVESVPKLKSDVERYGSRGWTYVQANYQSYGWKKNIDKLNPEQKKRLAELIEKVKQAR